MDCTISPARKRYLEQCCVSTASVFGLDSPPVEVCALQFWLSSRKQYNAYPRSESSDSPRQEFGKDCLQRLHSSGLRRDWEYSCDAHGNWELYLRGSHRAHTALVQTVVSSIIVGEAGLGKSALLCQLAHDVASEALQRETAPIPLQIDLERASSLAIGTPDIETYVQTLTPDEQVRDELLSCVRSGHFF